jgi:hypothetical protein
MAVKHLNYLHIKVCITILLIYLLPETDTNMYPIHWMLPTWQAIDGQHVIPTSLACVYIHF